MSLLQLGLMVGAVSVVLLALVALCVVMVVRLRRLTKGTTERRRAAWHAGIIIVWTVGLIIVASAYWLPFALERYEERDGWKRYTLQQGGFSVRFPQPPTFESIPLTSSSPFASEKSLGPMISNVYGVDRGDLGSSYYVIFHKYPHRNYPRYTNGMPKESEAGFLLHQSRDTLLAYYHARLLSHRDILLDGYAGTEYAFRIEKIGEMHMVRAYLVKDRMYILLAGPGPESSPRFAEKFFNSFKLAE